MLLQKSIEKELLPACFALPNGWNVFKSWAMICVQVWRWRCLDLCLTAMDDLQWFVPPGYRTVHISERLWTVLFQYIVVFLHVFERCMMYDTIFQARIRQFLSGDPPSNQHPMSQLPDVTTGVAWTLFTVWTRVLPPFSPPVGWWIHFSKWLKVVDKYVEESDFYVQNHPYVYYIQVIYCKDSTCYWCAYHWFTIPAYTACCF